MARTWSERLDGRRREIALHVRGGAYAFLAPRTLARLLRLYALDRRGRNAYTLLSEAEVLRTRTSDTAFVFGSGRSLLEITSEQWQEMAAHNTISLREFPRQDWIRADYHLTSEVDFVDEYAERIRNNPLYERTVFVAQHGIRAERANELVGRQLLPIGARLFRFKRVGRWRDVPPSRRPSRLVHGYNSIFDATNLAIALGFSRIVLVGTDYSDKGYFWLEPGETRSYEAPGITAETLFTGYDAIVRMMGAWHDLLAEENVELSVLNPRSLLAQRLPVYTF